MYLYKMDSLYIFKASFFYNDSTNGNNFTLQIGNSELQKNLSIINRFQ